jgi:FkbM family methyltransferase
MIRFLFQLKYFLDVVWIRFVLVIAWTGFTKDLRIFWKRSRREKLWQRNNYENTKKIDFDFLNEKSLVIDVGGHIGIFASQIFCRYNCSLVIFEPIHEFTSILKAKFSKNKKVSVIEAAIGNMDGTISLYNGDGATSQFFSPETKADQIRCELVDIKKVIKKYKYIDLLAINCEGGEYNIINRIISLKLNKKIKSLLIQFHQIDKNSAEEVEKIIKELSKTHKIVFHFEWVWIRFDLI